MSKTGILTHYYKSKNIGGLLQAYALCAFLRAQGVAAEQLVFDLNTYDETAARIHGQLRRITISKLLKYPLVRAKQFYQKYQNKKIVAQVQAQNKIFEEFEQFIPHSAQVYTNATVSQANAQYDTFITGSDQVFSQYLLPFSAYYGEFATPDKKVISYAASSDRKQFGAAAEKLFVQKLARLNAISVREKTLKDYIEHITDRKAAVVLDPTFLLSPEEWLQIAHATPVPQKPYIFCYFLGEKCAWQREAARAYADKYGYEIVHLPYIMRSVRPADRVLHGQGRYDVGPREFIALVRGAQCVFTDSFHGMVFAVNFGRNFYVFDRNDARGAESMNARIIDTLEALGLSSRHLTDKKTVLDNAPVDFARSREILEEQRRFSAQWLADALR